MWMGLPIKLEVRIVIACHLATALVDQAINICKISTHHHSKISSTFLVRQGLEFQ